MTTHQCITKTLIVGLSGPSSSGKTTIARLLRSIFNIPASAATNHNSITLFILHQDDFYKTDAEIPIVTTPLTQRRLQDWDSAASLDLGLLEGSLRYIATHGRLPRDLASQEDANAVSESGVSDGEIEGYRREVVATVLNPPAAAAAAAASPPPAGEAAASVPAGVAIKICILDGFLLYADPHPAPSIPRSITDLLHLRLFLRSTFARVKARREARSGYVTLEGFWRDPHGYVDEVVWPNYVREHAWMFEAGDVDRGRVRDEVRERWGIEVAPGMGERGVEELLGWAVGVVGGRVGREVRGGGGWEGGLCGREERVGNE